MHTHTVRNKSHILHGDQTRYEIIFTGSTTNADGLTVCCSYPCFKVAMVFEQVILELLGTNEANEVFHRPDALPDTQLRGVKALEAEPVV